MSEAASRPGDHVYSKTVKSSKAMWRRIPLDALEWRFCVEGDDEYCPAVDFLHETQAAPHSWTAIRLPHDFLASVAPVSTGDVAHGFRPFKRAWYKVRVPVIGAPPAEGLQLSFDGVAWRSVVWVDGVRAAEHWSAYTPFTVDIPPQSWASSESAAAGTRVESPSETNAETRVQRWLNVTVAVDSTPSFEHKPNPADGSWWYDGGGIYRNVFLQVFADRCRIAEYGVYLPALVEGKISRNGNKEVVAEAGRVFAEVELTKDCAGRAAVGETELAVRIQLRGPLFGAGRDAVAIEKQILEDPRRTTQEGTEQGLRRADGDASSSLPDGDPKPAGTVVEEATQTLRISESFDPEQPKVRLQLSVRNPSLWDGARSPALYRAEVSLLSVNTSHAAEQLLQEPAAGNGNPPETTAPGRLLLDSVTEQFGFRRFHWDADLGFFLNDRPFKIQGFANHQDFAGVGVAVPDSLQDYRVAGVMQGQLSANAWRTAHNPATPALLDACDRWGMLVWAENHRNKIAPASYLQDLQTMIRRDRNRASIFVWSVCNERLCCPGQTTATTNCNFGDDAVVDTAYASSTWWWPEGGAWAPPVADPGLEFRGLAARIRIQRIRVGLWGFVRWMEPAKRDVALAVPSRRSLRRGGIGRPVRWDGIQPQRQRKALRGDFDFLMALPSSWLCPCYSQKNIIAEIRALDPLEKGQRPISAACNSDSLENAKPFLSLLDVIGINYHVHTYDTVRAIFPGKPMIVSEASSDYSTRGEYKTSAQKKYVSSFDTEFPPWGSTAEDSWCTVSERPFVAGQFYWTGFDYRGEPTPFWEWPSVNSHFGNVDLAGFAKDNAWYHKAVFADAEQEQVLHLVAPDWWKWERDSSPARMKNNPQPEGSPRILPVWVYTNLAAPVQLMGTEAGGHGSERVLGKRKILTERCRHLEWSLDIDTLGNITALKAVTIMDGAMGEGPVHQQDGEKRDTSSSPSKPKARVGIDTVRKPGPAAKLHLVVDWPDDGRKERQQTTPPEGADAFAEEIRGADIRIRTAATAKREQTFLVRVEVHDAAGVLVRDARVLVEFSARTPHAILGTGNGDPTCTERETPYNATHARRTTFHGLARVVVRVAKTGSEGRRSGLHGSLGYWSNTSGGIFSAGREDDGQIQSVLECGRLQSYACAADSAISLVDVRALCYLEEFLQEISAHQKHPNQVIVPLRTLPNGNCLVNAVSLAVSGNEASSDALREEMAKELDAYRGWYMEKLTAAHGGESLAQSEYDEALARARAPGAFLSNIHIIALASVLERPIILVASRQNMRDFGVGYHGMAGAFLPLRFLTEASDAAKTTTTATNTSAPTSLRLLSPFARPRELNTAVDVLLLLKHSHAGCGEEYVAVLETMSKMVRNLVQFPDDRKYRKINPNNAAFWKKCGRFVGGLELFLALGFEYEKPGEGAAAVDGGDGQGDGGNALLPHLVLLGESGELNRRVAGTIGSMLAQFGKDVLR
eukprot:g14384.t1